MNGETALEHPSVIDSLADDFWEFETDSDCDEVFEYLSAKHRERIEKTAKRFGRSAKRVESDVFDCMAGKPVRCNA